MKIFLILLLLQLPVFAAARDGTILIKRGGRRGKALLDYKFVFMDQGAAFASDTKAGLSRQSGAKAGTESPRSKVESQLGKFSGLKSNKVKPLTFKPKPSARRQSVAHEDAYDESNWNDFALDESLEVDAKILN